MKFDGSRLAGSLRPRPQTAVLPPSSFAIGARSKPESDDALQQGIQQLVRRTCLDGRRVEELLTHTATMITQSAEAWRTEIQALLDSLELVKTREGDSKPERAIAFQLERVRREYLLSELATRNFLPGYGFPTGVVSLITTTMEDLNRRQQREVQEREDNRAVRHGYPSRELAIAIRDYAPGTDTVLDGRVYRSGGVTLNWHVPPDQEGATRNSIAALGVALPVLRRQWHTPNPA